LDSSISRNTKVITPMTGEQTPISEGQTKDPAGINRRACVRYRCSRPVPRRMAIAESYQSLNGWLVNISVIGLGLLLDSPLEVGTLLFVEMEAPLDMPPVELLAQVQHVTATADGEWLIGCEFVNRLGEDELKALLR
jgi:hypothetical protein